MTKLVAPLIALLLCASPLFAAGLGTPSLSEPIADSAFFDADRFLTTAGVKYSAADDLVLEPEWGVGYRAMGRETSGGIEELTHRVHAQAGWRLSLAQTLYLSAAAKLPVLTVESADRSTGQRLGTRYGYDFTRPFRTTLSWTGEVGIHLSPRTDLGLYYDQSPVSGWSWEGRQQEERIGTRLIWRFW